MGRHIFLGVGGGGCNFVQRSLDKPLPGVEWIVADSDLRALKKNKAPRRILLGSNLPVDDPSREDPLFGQNLVRESEGDLAALLKGADSVFLATGLGGNTGSSAAAELARIAKKHSVPFVAALVTLPFDFEGPERTALARQGLEWVRDSADVTLKFGNEALARLTSPDHDFFDVFGRFDSLMFIGARCLRDLFLHNDRGDTLPILKEPFFGPNRAIRLGQGVASGPERVQEAWRLASKPLLAEHAPEETEKVWVHLLLSATPTEKEMDDLALRLTELKPDGKGIFITHGTVPQGGDNLRLTLLTSAARR